MRAYYPVGASAACAVIVCALLVASGCDSGSGSGYLNAAEAGGVRAEVSVPQGEAASIGTYRLHVRTAGRADKELTVARDGTIVGLWVADLYGSATPEVVVAMSSSGSGSYGTVDVYQITPDGLSRRRPEQSPGAAVRGYAGHDRFDVVEGLLVRTFPVYTEGDANAAPRGGEITLRYSFEDLHWVPLSGADR